MFLTRQKGLGGKYQIPSVVDDQQVVLTPKQSVVLLFMSIEFRCDNRRVCVSSIDEDG
jgi:hypothetical protein